MKFYDFYIKFYKSLNHLYKNKNYLDNIFFLLSCEIFKCSKIDIRILLINNIILSYNIITKFNKYVNKLLSNIPIQYILNKCYFYGLSFFVDKRCFIPRIETEDIISLIINDYHNLEYSNLNILDLGAGSGCISITLKKFFVNSLVYALDISYESLEVLKINKNKYQQKNIFIIQDDILCLSNLNVCFDIIVSNPPYILCDEMYDMDANVYLNEPYISLFADKFYPYILYEKIALLAKNQLSRIGALYLEINPILHENIVCFLNKIGFNNILTKKDNNNYNRIIKASF
jgi:release factor glutamine methyltransferase